MSSLVRSEHFAQQTDEGHAQAQKVQRRQGSHETTEEEVAPAKSPAKRAAKKTTAADGVKPKPKSKPRARKPRVDQESGTNETTLESELRLPRMTKSPFFDSVEAPTALDEPSKPTADASELTKSGKPRKPRTKKKPPEGDASEPKPKKTRVTKAKIATKTGRATREAVDDGLVHRAVDKDATKATEETSTSTHDEQNQSASIWDVPESPRSKENTHHHQRPNPLAEGLDLEAAVSRRRNWTPPRDTVAQSPSTVSTGKENRPSLGDTMTGTFTHLISNFTYDSPSDRITNHSTLPNMPTLGVTKRRRVELIELPDVQTTDRASSPEKGKAPKKKPRTITDLVTGQYAPKDELAEAQVVTSDFFSPRTSTTKVPLNNVEVTQKKPQRKRSKSRDGTETAASRPKPRARKASTKLAGKTKPATEKLLSPTSAVSRVNRQEVLFGTSSQLALEDSPTTVRQIQLAIKESEQDEGNTANYALRVPPRWPRLQRIEGKRGLWRESTRDSDGGLLEDTENIYIPEPDRTQDLPLLMDPPREEPNLPTEFADIDDFAPPAPIAISSDLPTPPGSQLQKQNVELATSKSLSDLVFDDIDDFENGLPPSNQNAEPHGSFADIDDFQPAPSTESHQHQSNILKKPPASAPASAAAKGSPRQRQSRPPIRKNAIAVVTASVPPPVRRPPSQQRLSRLPSTPPKGSGRFIDIEEILDSEDEVLAAFSPTPPRVRKLQDSPPLPLAFECEPSTSAQGQVLKPDITPVSRIQMPLLEWANVKPSICAAITAHVRSIPPTTDPKKPSWHEKILMYDPLILEDFTDYLNCNTKFRTYKRATQKQIKAYNNKLKMEGNAILGVERDDQVLVIEKELEVFMVRDWCQEMSICCIHAKESRGRGTARKGFY